MKTNKFWSYYLDTRFLLVFVAIMFLWVVVMPDGSAGNVSYSVARDIVRHGCAASIDDNQKLHVCPNYILLGRIKRLLMAVLLALGFVSFWQSLPMVIQNPLETTRKLYQKDFFGFAWQHFNYPLTSHRRPPPVAVFSASYFQ